MMLRIAAITLSSSAAGRCVAARLITQSGTSISSGGPGSGNLAPAQPAPTAPAPWPSTGLPSLGPCFDGTNITRSSPKYSKVNMFFSETLSIEYVLCRSYRLYV